MHKLMTLVINLDRSDDRLDVTRTALGAANIAWQRQPAVDGRGKTASDFAAYNASAMQRRYGRAMNGGEVGCYLSHIDCLKTFVASDAEYLLVLEDDALISKAGMQTVQAFLDWQLANPNQKWDIVHLSNKRKKNARDVATVGGASLRRAFYFPILATALLWSRNGAQAFLDSAYTASIAGPIDSELRSFCSRRGRAYSFDTPAFPPRDVESEINDPGMHRTGSNGPKRGTEWRYRVTRKLPDYLYTHWNLVKSRF